MRKPVKDTSVHPYNGIGRIICKIYDPETKKYIEKSLTAFIVAKNLIMTTLQALTFKKSKTMFVDIEFFP